MTDVAELSGPALQTHEEIKERFSEVGSRLGSLIFRGMVVPESQKISHWTEPGAIVAAETDLEALTIEELYADTGMFAERIIEATSRVTGVPAGEITGPSKKRWMVTARHLSMYILRERGNLSYPAIGRAFSNRDHTSVIYAVDKIKGYLASERGSGAVSREIKKIESEAASYLDIYNGRNGIYERDNLLDVIAVTKDGLYEYPTSKILKVYANALRIRDPDALVLDRNHRIVSDEILEAYGHLAMNLIDEALSRS